MSRPALPPDALVLGPMATLSHRGFRELVEGFGGCDILFTEMSNAKSVLLDSRWESYYIDPGADPSRTVIQILGSEAQTMADAVSFIKKQLEESGRRPFGFDLNMGCSAPEIIRCGGGAVWLGKPDQAARLVAAVRDRIPDYSLSVKLRIGETDDPEALLSFCRAIVAEGADFLTLHPRIRPEKYSRPPRWERVALLARELPVPVLGNGDVDGFSAWRRRVGESGCSGIMIARAAARQPWIFALLRGLQADPAFSMEIDLAEVARTFVDLLARFQPPAFQKSRARRFFYYLSENLAYGNRIKYQSQACETPEECLRTFLGYFRDAPGERIKRFSLDRVEDLG